MTLTLLPQPPEDVFHLERPETVPQWTAIGWLDMGAYEGLSGWSLLKWSGFGPPVQPFTPRYRIGPKP